MAAAAVPTPVRGRRHVARLFGAVALAAVGTLVLKAFLGSSDEATPEGLVASSNYLHPHQGVLPPFELGPIGNIKAFSEEESRTLQEGKLVLRQEEDTTRGKGLAVRDIAATPDEIMEELRDFEHYKKKVSMCTKSTPYFRQPLKGGKERVKVEMSSTVIPGFSFNCYFDHTVDKKGHSMIWSLDYQRRSDVDDIQGMWYVAPHPTKTGWSRVYYQIDMRLRYRVPSVLYRALAKSSLSNAVSWVKDYSERRSGRR